MASRFYTTPAGERYPLKEARYDMQFKAYRSDRRKAKPGDSGWCLMALGIRRNKDVLDVYIGSGHDAYVIFKETADDPAQAVHFVIRSEARKIVDAFDKDRAAKTQPIELKKPPISWTLARRRENNARRRAEIRNGAVIKRRGKIAKSRMERLGVKHRQRPKISDSGSVSMFEQAAVV